MVAVENQRYIFLVDEENLLSLNCHGLITSQKSFNINIWHKWWSVICHKTHFHYNVFEIRLLQNEFRKTTLWPWELRIIFATNVLSIFHPCASDRVEWKIPWWIFLSYNSPHGQIWKITDDEWTFEEMFLSYNPPGWWRGLHTVLASHPNLARCSVPGEELWMVEVVITKCSRNIWQIW